MSRMPSPTRIARLERRKERLTERLRRTEERAFARFEPDDWGDNPGRVPLSRWTRTRLYLIDLLLERAGRLQPALGGLPGPGNHRDVEQ